MRRAISLIALASLASLSGTGCTHVYNVRTRPAPGAMLTSFKTFHLVPTPARDDDHGASVDDDPMRRKSIANRALRASVQRAFEALGYIDAEREPDIVVAVYARSLDRVDLTQWPCGYPYSPDWWAAGLPENATGHDAGTVLVDVLDPQSLALLWRGSAKAMLSPDSKENIRQLQRAAASIVSQFPRANGGELGER